MPFRSTAQQRFAFATGQPWAKRWADETDFSKLPKRAKRKPLGKRTKAFTLDQLEAFVSSDAYDPHTADLIAMNVPALKAAGADGELISPGVRRIRGNLCNVHGRYGPCDGGKAGKKPKGRKPAAPKKTDAQRAQERDAKRAQNVDAVAKRMADTDTGLSPSGSKALVAFAKGQQPDATQGAGLAQMGLAERASDGTYRMTPTGRAVVSAMQAGDYQRAVDAISRGTDASAKRQERATAQQSRRDATAKRQQDAAGKRAAAQMGRELAKRQPSKAAAGGKKKPEKPAAEKPLKVDMPKRGARGSAPSVGGVAGAAANKKPVTPAKPAKETPEKAPAKQIAPALREAAQSLSDGKELSDADTQALIRNGLARIVKGEIVLTAAGQRATLKTFRVFKDASGKYRWVAQSSTAFQDRDKEIVSTKALADDCAFADETGSYGPLRWWHSPGLDLGDCDFNAMHGRVLIESGTFRTPAIAHKVARAASELEISLGFLHLPTEPDADGVFHHIRRFERSLVPRGKASNRFTAFSVKELPTMDKVKIEGLKAHGFTDDDVTWLLSQASATEKTATDQGVAYKAEEPVIELPDVVINGVTYKAMPPVPPVVEEKDDGEGDMEVMAEEPMEEEPAEGGLTLSPEDLTAISEAVAGAIQAGLSQVMGALDLEKKVASHVQGLMQPYQATKDASDAEKAEQIATLQASLKDHEARQTALKAQLDELMGLQPEIVQRPSESGGTLVNPWIPQDQQLLGAVKGQVPADQQFEFGDLVTNLFGNINGTPGQA
jgi:hypothetical protein